MHAVVRTRPLVFHLAVPLLVGAISSQLSGNAGGTYQALNLPAFAPPGIVLPIMWTILYLLMGISAYLIASERGITEQERQSALLLYGLMLVISCLWSPLFFRFHLYSVSAWWYVVLIGVTVLCAAVFYRIRPMAGLLYIPTIIWLMFACILNFFIAKLN